MVALNSQISLYLCGLMQENSPFVSRVKELIDSAQTIVVTNHVNPDGDAVGSALALAALLHASSKGKTINVVMPNAYAQNLKWMEGNDQVVFFEQQQTQAASLVEQAALIFHLDYNSLKRAGPMEETLEGSSAKKVIIDHHQQPDDFADAIYSDTSMSSTCEMVYHFAAAMNWLPYFDTAIAEALYCGIATDTGNFRFSSTTPTTHRTVAFLLEKGVDPGRVASFIYDSSSPDRLKLLSTALNRMEVLMDCRTAIIALSAEDLSRNNYQKGDTEGFVNYGLSMLGIELSIFVSEKDDKVKLSFRSKTNFDVNTFARKYFNGGGHKNAAGALSPHGFTQTLDKLKEFIANHKSELQNLQSIES